ncbi:MAG: hypothetical protein WKF88_05660 [Ferruginibacter sp.]
MAKDPAMLWYWSDWHSGTALMSRFLKGCYMDLLHAQFNHGRLSLEEIKICLGSDFGPSWPALQKKFKQDNNLFFNERLEHEKEKRAAYSESRRQSRLGSKKTYDKTYVNHTNERMDNTNENTDFLKEGAGRNLLIPEMFALFKQSVPAYPGEKEKDYEQLLAIANFIFTQLKCEGPLLGNVPPILAEWDKCAVAIAQDKFYKSKSLKTISTHIQEIYQVRNGDNKIGRTAPGNKQSKSTGANQLLDKLEQEFTGGNG